MTGRFIPDVYLNILRERYPHEFPEADDIQARTDELRDVIDRDLIVTDPPAADWRPDPKDLA